MWLSASVVLSALILVLTMSWSGSVGPAPQAAAKEPLRSIVLKLNDGVSASSAGVLMAISEGLFQQQDVTFQLLAGTGDVDAISTVARDECVIGLASAADFLKARADGLPIVAIASLYAVSSVGFYTLADQPLLVPSDLQGKRIGSKPGTELATILRSFIARNSIAQSGLTIVHTETPVADLLEGKIDVLIGHREREGLLLEEREVAFRRLNPDAFGVHAAGTLLIVNERALSDAGPLTRFLSAMIQGWSLAYADYNRSIPALAQALHKPARAVLLSRLMDEQRQFLRPSGTRLGELDLQQLKSLQEELMAQQFIRQPVDLSNATNADLLREVYRTRSDTLSQ